MPRSTRRAYWLGLGADEPFTDALVNLEAAMQHHRPEVLIWRGRFQNPFAGQKTTELDPHNLSSEDLSVLFHPHLMDDPVATQIRWLLPHAAGRAFLEKTPPWPEDVFYALRGHWETWPKAERDAIRAVLGAAWKRLIEGDGTSVFDGWCMMSALAFIGEDLRSYLDAWLQNPASEAAWNLTFWAMEFQEALGCAGFQGSLIPREQHLGYRQWLRHAPLETFAASTLHMEDSAERKATLEAFKARLDDLRRRIGENG